VVAATDDKPDKAALEAFLHLLFQSNIPHVVLFLRTHCQGAAWSVGGAAQSQDDEMKTINSTHPGGDASWAQRQAYDHLVDISRQHGYESSSIIWQQQQQHDGGHTRLPARSTAATHAARAAPAPARDRAASPVECLCVFSRPRTARGRGSAGPGCAYGGVNDPGEDAMEVDAVGAPHEHSPNAHRGAEKPGMKRDGWDAWRWSGGAPPNRPAGTPSDDSFGEFPLAVRVNVEGGDTSESATEQTRLLSGSKQPPRTC